MWNLKIQRADYTTPFHARDLDIHRSEYPPVGLAPVLHEYQGITVYTHKEWLCFPPWIPRDNCIYIQGMTVFYTWDKYYILGQLIQKENFGSCIGMIHSCYIYYRKKYLMLWKDVHSKLNLKWKLFKTYSIIPFLQIIYVHNMYTKDIRRL